MPALWRYAGAEGDALLITIVDDLLFAESNHDLPIADATIAKLTSDREKLETYTKKTLGNVQEKYSVLVQTYKNQIRDKQERISRLEGELERHRRELASSREFSAVTPNGGGEACV